jgi:hypothetical protein
MTGADWFGWLLARDALGHGRIHRLRLPRGMGGELYAFEQSISAPARLSLTPELPGSTGAQQLPGGPVES